MTLPLPGPVDDPKVQRALEAIAKELPASSTGGSTTVNVGTTTTGAAGTSASVTNSGTTTAAVLDFTIPRGATGATGATGSAGPAGATGPAGSTGAAGSAATVAVGTTTTGAAGSSASVSNSGTSSAATLNFTIPRGDTGATGSTGATGATGPAGATGATGAKGDKGDTGATGATGSSGVVAVTSPITNSGTSTSASLGFDSTGYVKTSDTGTVTSTMIADGTIANADVSASAGIVLSKLATDPLARANHTGTQTASTVSDFDTQVRTSRLDQMAAPTGAVSLNSQKITSLATPTVSTDAATKAYVDTTASSGTPDADATTKGKVQLAGDLSGTAASPQIATGVIVNADVNSSAAIALSKLASGTSAQIIVANSSGVPTYVALSGDATVSNAGALTVNKVTGWQTDVNDLVFSTGSISLTSAAAGNTTVDITWGDGAAHTPIAVLANITGQTNYAVMTDTYTTSGTKGRFTARVKHIDNTSQTATVNFNFIAIY